MEAVGRQKTEYKRRRQRRQFDNQYKRRILAEVDGCQGQGEIGSLLRREGLYSSHLRTWRRQATRGELDGATSGKRGRKANPQADELTELQRENKGLRQQLEQAESIISAQKKLSHALEQIVTGNKDKR
jgi:transposase-like protein